MRLFLSILLAALLFQACEKETGILGLNTLPEEDVLAVVMDTALNVSDCRSNIESTVYWRDNAPILYLGGYNDPVFGLTVSDLTVPLYATNMSACLRGDSVGFILSDAYLYVQRDSAYYGDTTNTTEIEVYELKNKLIDSTIYRNLKRNAKYLPTSSNIPIATLRLTGGYKAKYKVHQYDSVAIDRTYALALIERLKPIYRRDTTPDYFNLKLQNVFYGVMLKTKEQENIAMRELKNIKIRFRYKETENQIGTYYWDLSNVSSFLTISDTTKKTEIRDKFPPLVMVEHAYSASSEFNTKITQNNSGKMYIQSLRGTKGIFKLSSLGDRYGSKYMINKATLTIPVDSTDVVKFPAVSTLALDVYKNATDTTALTSLKASLSKNTYTVDLTAFMLATVRNVNTAEYRYELTMPANNAGMGRTVLNCGENNKNIKLKVLYTKYK